MPRNKQMTDSELRAVIENYLIKSDWFDNAETQSNMRRAIDSYLGRKQRVSVAGSPDMRSEDVADMIEALTAQIMPAFHFDEVAHFDAHGVADVDQSRLESKICNQFIFDFNDGDFEIQTAVKDALLLRNGIIKVYLFEEVTKQRQRFAGLSDIELDDAQQPSAPNQEIEVTLIRFDEATQTTDLNITRTTTFRRLAVESIDPVNFLIEREYTKVDPSDALVVGERRFETRSDLVAQGFPRDLVDSIPATQTDTREASLARNRTRTAPMFDFTSKALQHVEIFELYAKIDFDGDGIAERRRVLYAGGTSGGIILENKPHPMVPYAVGVPIIYPHRWQGISIFDKLEELENQKSKALTQYAANIQNANFPELVVADGEVAEADYTTRRASGVIRADRVDAVRELPVTNIGRESLSFLNYLDKVRAERGGASLDLQSAEAQIASDSAHGTERMFSAREQLATLICNTIGDTLVKQMFSLVHRTLREFFIGEQDFHVGQAQFASANPGDWPARMKVRVTAGMSNSERQQKRAVLETALLQQEKLWTGGMDGVLVSFDTYYSTLIDWSKTGGLQTPRRYWVDPNSEEAQQALQQKQEQEAEQQRKQEELTREALQLQLLVGDRDNQTELVKHFTQLRKDYWQGVLTSEMEELRTQAQGSEDADPDPDEIDADQETGRQRSEQGAVANG